MSGVREAGVPPGERSLVAVLGVALLGTAFLVDPFAAAAFDAPKQLVAVLCAAIAAALLAWRGGFASWPPTPVGRSCAWLALGGAAAAVLAAAVSPRASAAFDTLRAWALFALFVPIGASLSDIAMRRVSALAALALVATAAMSLLQAAGFALPLPLAQVPGRTATGALLGNEGYVALAAALFAAAGLAFAFDAATARARAAALAAIVLGIATIAINRQLTAAIAFAAATLLLMALRRHSPRSVATGFAALALMLAATLVSAPDRSASVAPPPDTRLGALQQATTWRAGAWLATLEMIAARPLAGHGPGAFAREAQRWRFRAEARVRERLLPPPTATAFAQSHQEYLQLAAEAGVPAALALVSALALLLVALARRAARAGAREPLALLGVLAAGAVAALAWFPLQIPLTAVLLLLACGRAWRIVSQPDEARA